MTTTAQAPQRPGAVFLRGSTLRHVLVMTATGSIGLMAIFSVDLLSLLYISWLGDPGLTAGVGFASNLSFVVMSINIGMSIGVSAMVSRSIGAGDRPTARRYAASGVALTICLASVVSFGALPFRHMILTALGARGTALEAGATLLLWTLPAANMMAVGMVLAGLLRAVGDARRAMYVTLFGAVVTAILDPILIFGLHLGVVGAAISADLSRIAWVVVGGWGAVHVYNMLARPSLASVAADARPIMAIAGPAILANLAAPVSSLYGVGIMSQFGQSAVAGMSIVDRIVPVAFGPLFAMSSVVGPIVGQNFGAGQIDRVRSTLTNCFAFSGVYVVVVWGVLWVSGPLLARLFGASGDTARLVVFYCQWGAAAWVFLGCLFAANAAYNNLGYAALSTLFNWGRATLGFMPFVTLGARWYGPEGVIMGAVAGAALFGAGSIASAYWIAARLAKKAAGARKMS